MLEKLMTRSTLKNLAGAAAFQCGEEYFASGFVERLHTAGQKVSARVIGTETYRVELWDKDDKLGYDCTCPRAADGYFCKHCVAVGLAWLAELQVEGVAGQSKAKKKRRDPWQDIRDYLALQKPEVLIALVLDVAQRDDRLYQSLSLKAERTGAGSNVQQIFRKAINKATRVHGFVDWREAGDFAGDLEQLVESLEELLTPDSAGILVELLEYAIERVEDAMQNIDDSNGGGGSIEDALCDLHIKACELAQPEPGALAERLFRMEMTLPIGICSFSATTYSHVLGEQGLRRYRELASEEWQKIKLKQPGDSYDYHRSRVTHIMESLAEASGDVEGLVAIKAQDLSFAYHYLTIAEIWTKAGQDDKALEWAERGLRAFPKGTDNRLRDFIVAAYLQRQRNDEALQLTWVQFEEQATLEHYQKLHKVAKPLGVWPEQRERALAWVAEVIARNAAATDRWNPKPSIPNYTLRVAIALWENDLDAAWTAVNAGVCNRDQLITLAGKLESKRGNDAIALYRRIIPAIIEQTNNTAYADAVKLIRRIGVIMNAQQLNREFGYYLAELRVRFKPKRNFIKLLDGVGVHT
ncbi:SWIM zinc finger family protein [Methyloglobulus sp.]|uniref:SWIM zinc finger family protein n=1 Tax=Methyloglobulus sp. TaxID=2518622 RepID=UPI003989376C